MHEFDCMSRHARRLAIRMDALGYHYDTIESYRGYLRFFVTGCGVVTFTSWKEVREWLKEMEG